MYYNKISGQLIKRSIFMMYDRGITDSYFCRDILLGSFRGHQN